MVSLQIRRHFQTSWTYSTGPGSRCIYFICDLIPPLRASVGTWRRQSSVREYFQFNSIEEAAWIPTPPCMEVNMETCTYKQCGLIVTLSTHLSYIDKSHQNEWKPARTWHYPSTKEFSCTFWSHLLPLQERCSQKLFGLEESHKLKDQRLMDQDKPVLLESQKIILFWRQAKCCLCITLILYMFV